MTRKQPQKKHFLYSLILHGILLSVLVISFDFSAPMPVFENKLNDNVINAMVMQSAPKNNSKKIPLPTVAAAKPKVEPTPKPEPIVPPKPIVKQQETPKPVEKPIPEPVKEAIVIPDKKQKKVKEDLIQKQLLADLEKQTLKKPAPTKPKAQQQKSLEADFANEMKALKAKALEEQMAQEKKRLDGVQAAKMQGIVDKYKALILQAISQHWLVPNNADKTLSAQLLIRIAPGGMVLDVQVMKSSGDESLDRSARAAVFKASPLPVPTDNEEFEPFRQFVLKVKPENVLERA